MVTFSMRMSLIVPEPRNLRYIPFQVRSRYESRMVMLRTCVPEIEPMAMPVPDALTRSMSMFSLYPSLESLMAMQSS